MVVIYSVPYDADISNPSAWCLIDSYKAYLNEGALKYRKVYNYEHIWELEYDTQDYDATDLTRYCPPDRQVTTKFHLGER